MGVVSRRWVWVESMCVSSGCGCKEVHVYRFPHITYPLLLLYLFFLQQHPYFLFISLIFFVLVPVLFGN